MEEKKSIVENLSEQTQLPYFDQYFKHNDYIQNFELAAAMDITQHRVFDTLISCIQTLKYHKFQYLFQNQSGSKIIKINLEFFLQRYLKAHNIKSIKRTELRKAVKSLAQIVIIKDTKDGIRATPVFQDVYVDLKNNKIEIELSKYFSYETLTPGINTKSPGFTRLLNSTQSALKSVYSRIFYQYFYSKLAFKKYVEIEFDIMKLYRILGIVNEDGKFLKGKKVYSDISQFKRRCIIEPIEVINKHTDIEIIINDIKNGRKIVGFKFIAKIKGDNEKEYTQDCANNQLDIFKPIKENFKSKDDFIKFMKIHYKNRKITNNIPFFSPENYLVLDDKGMLRLENEEKGIYKFSDDLKKDLEIAKQAWNWLYENMNRVGVFDYITNLDKLNYKFKGVKFLVKNKIFACEKIEKDDSFWIIKGYIDDKTATMKIKLNENLEEYLDSIRQ